MSGNYYVVDGSLPQIREMIRASAAIPVFFNPVDIGERRFVDGGVRNVTPLNAAFQALHEIAKKKRGDIEDPDTIYVILASPLMTETIKDKRKMNDVVDILKRSIQLLTNEVYVNDLKMAVSINAAVKYYAKLKKSRKRPPRGFPYADHRYANLIVIQPEKEHMSSLEFKPNKIRSAFNAGRRKAKEAVEAAEAGDGSYTDLEALNQETHVLKAVS
jgi:predicted acylesterase/phospholipase RssA